MNVTTKTGDGGYTALAAGGRVPKDDPRIECLGAVDELDAFLAAALLAGPSSRGAETVHAVRDELFSVILPAVAGIPSRPADIARLEVRIAELEAHIRRDNGFVRHWTRPASVALNIARTICRRAERRAVTLGRSARHPVPGGAPASGHQSSKNASGKNAGDQNAGDNTVMVYLNRLSDLLFLLAVYEETA